MWNTRTIGRHITVMIQSFSNPFTSESPSDWLPVPGTIPMHRFSSVAPHSYLCCAYLWLSWNFLLISPNYIWLVTLMKNFPMIVASFTTTLHLFLYLLPFLLFPFSLIFNLRTDTVIRKLQRNTSVSPKPLFPDCSSMQIPTQICHYTCTIKVKVIHPLWRIAWLLVTAIQCSELCKGNTNENATTSLTQMFSHIVCWNYYVENIAMMKMPWQKTWSERQSLSLRIVIMNWSK